MTDHIPANTAYWNELASLHKEGSSYDIESFKQGKSTLHDIELEELGDVRGKSLLHLQCHIGLDSLSLARLGAHVTGVDFSDRSIEFAQQLATELSIDAKFICADVLELSQALTEEFDIVFTSYGVLCWLSDLPKWGAVVSKFLKRGGRFVIVEDHPVSYVLDDKCEPGDWRIGYSYFDGNMLTLTAKGSYASATPFKRPMQIHEWQHSLEETMGALLGAGLRIESFREYPYCMFKKFPWMVQDDNGWWLSPIDDLAIPFLFSLRASK